jgi:hypothetical protein
MKIPGLVIAISIWQFIDAALIALFTVSMVFIAAVFPSMMDTMVQDYGQQLPPGYDAAALTHAMWIVTAVVSILGLCVVGVSLAGGIGMLKRKNWGRVLSITHACIVTFISGISTLGSFGMGGLISAMESDISTAGAMPVFAVLGLISLVGLALGIFALVYLARRKTGEFFKPDAVMQSEPIPVVPAAVETPPPTKDDTAVPPDGN